jgi:hypothetical protein
MKLPLIVVAFLAAAIPANARFYSNWQCGEAKVQVQVYKNWGKDGERLPPTYVLEFEHLKTPNIRNFRVTDDGQPYLNGKRCKQLPYEDEN